MKNLLILILLFFSFGAMAETNLRCEFNKSCYNQSCTSYSFKDRTNNSPVNISYHEGFFSNKLSYNSFEVVDDIFFKDKKITFVAYNDEDKLTYLHNIDRQFLTYSNTVLESKVKDFIEGKPVYSGMPNFRFRHEYLCTKID